MADGRHLEKKIKTAISQQRFDRSAQNLAKCSILGHLSELKDSLPTSALNRGATPYRLVPKCVI